MASTTLSLQAAFRRLGDPRRRHGRKHSLLNITFITVCAVIAGASDWHEIVLFGRSRRDWLAKYLDLRNGIPSHDTIERFFDAVSPQAFESCVREWLVGLVGKPGMGHLAIDGKTLRGSGNGKKGWRPLHLVSAWASECGLSLGQVAVDEKSNEITAIPELLDLLDITGALVTIDAMGCQREIAEKIVDKGGDYVLSVKGNQPGLVEEIQQEVEMALEHNGEGVELEQHETVETGHGRQETRRYLILRVGERMRASELWKGLKVIGMVTRERIANGKKSEQTSYFIGSRVMEAKEYAKVLRSHWSIEVGLHWQLDVSFGEDGNRVQRRNGAQNLAYVRRLALNLLKATNSPLSIAKKRYAAALDPAFLEEVLAATNNLGNV
jgi:predicted transposase YbfD/YdcC